MIKIYKAMQKYTTLKQSKYLLSINVPSENTSLCWVNHYNDKSVSYSLHLRNDIIKPDGKDIIPCWSLSDLIEIIIKYELPDNIIKSDNIFDYLYTAIVYYQLYTE